MAVSKLQEQKWQAESDANTMATYQEIINDKQRMQRAIKVAQNKAKDLNRRASAMNNVASYKNGGNLNKTMSRASKGRRK